MLKRAAETSLGITKGLVNVRNVNVFINVGYWSLLSIIFDSAFKFEMGLKFLNCKRSASGFLSRGHNTADFRHVGMQLS